MIKFKKYKDQNKMMKIKLLKLYVSELLVLQLVYLD